jgi:hypothetical protein
MQLRYLGFGALGVWGVLAALASGALMSVVGFTVLEDPLFALYMYVQQGFLVAMGFSLHFGLFGNRRSKWAVFVFGGFLWLSANIYQIFIDHKLHLSAFVVVGELAVFGALLYLTLCELLLTWGLAEKLTVVRGPRWVKEIEYLYLELGLIGVLWSVNRIDALFNRIDPHYDFVAPWALVTAVVLRLIKTRAEIGEWNKE